MNRIAVVLAAVAIVLPAIRTTAWAAGRPAKSKAGSKEDAKAANDPYQRICRAYLDGRWEDVQKDLKAGNEPPGLTAEQRVELAGIRAAVAECRPPWWESCKAGLRGQIHPVVWGHTFDMAFAPADKENLQMSVVNNRISLTVSWPIADMDSREKWEHGFTKGDVNEFHIWNTLGGAASWAQVSLQSMTNLNEKDRSGMLYYQCFRNDLTSACYTMPSGRRFAEFIYLMTWKEHYTKEDAYVRKALAAMFLVEVLTDPSKYPTLPVPKNVPAENTEEALAGQYSASIQKHDWTVAEDLALRKALKEFGAANNDAALLRTKHLVTLPNKLKVSLDPAGDEPLRPQRDAWLKKQVDKANSPAGK